MHHHHKLIVWQKAVLLSKLIYQVTENYPKHELFGLTSQLRRAGVSVPSNIAEGRRLSTKKDYHRFLSMPLGSCYEIDTQIQISKSLPWADNLSFSEIESILLEVMKILQVIMKNLKT
jgi:four helix bundle protein